MIHGKDIIIYEGSDEPVAIAASKSCTIDKQAGTVETSSPASGTARSYASGRTDWVCTMNNLVLSVKDYMLRVGETYFITMGVRGSSTDTITGYAICTECNITGTVGNLAQGSFRFQGSDRDGTLPPQPGETGYDMTVDQVTAIVYSVVGDGYLSRLHNDTAQGLITFNAGAYIPTGQSLRIGDAYLTYDAQNKMIKVWDGTGNEVRGFYATGSVSALGAANGSGGGGGGGGDLDRTGLFNILTGVPQDANEWISAKFLKLGNGLTAANDGTLSISGAVTSVGLTMPTGFTVTGSPITSSGTLAVSLASGYKLLTSSTVTPGTYTKVTVDTYGRVTGGTSLSKTDIPSLDYIPITGSDSISGKLEPLTDASYDIGASGYRWRNGYFSGTVHATTFDGNATSATTATSATSATSATTASKLSTTSKTAWGQTYWTSGGVPTSISGNMTNVGSISASDTITVTKTGTNGAAVVATNGNNSVGIYSSENHGLYDFKTGRWVIGDNGTNTWVCQTSGFFGVGVVSPSNSIYKMEVNGHIKARNVYGDYFAISDTLSNPYIRLSHSYNNIDYTYHVQAYNGLLQLGPTAAKSIKITSNGELFTKQNFILNGADASSSTGNTSQILFMAGTTAQVAISSNTNALIINPTLTTTTGQWVIGVNGHNTYTTGSGNFGIGMNNPSQKLHVSGNILATGGVTALSDMRQKTFLAGVNETMETLAELPIFYYKWKGESRDDYMHIGTSAQAVQKPFPELVLGKDELSVDYGVLGTTIGILNSRALVTLEQRVTALESKKEGNK